MYFWGSIRGTHRRRRSCKRQTQQHQERNELVPRLYVGHGEIAIVATEAHHRRGQHVRQLQEVQGHQGRQDDGELGHKKQKLEYEWNQSHDSCTHRILQYLYKIKAWQQGEAVFSLLLLGLTLGRRHLGVGPVTGCRKTKQLLYLIKKVSRSF